MTAPDPRLNECATCLGCPDCGPTSTKRTVGAIAHRLEKVSEGPWTAWDRGIGYEIHSPHGDPINDRCRETFSKGDAEFIAMAPGDVHYLLAELRKAHEALERVEELHTPMAIYELDENGHVNSDDESKYVRSICSICSDSSVTESLDDGNYDISGEWGEVTWPCPTAAAVAAAKGDEA